MERRKKEDDKKKKREEEKRMKDEEKKKKEEEKRKKEEDEKKKKEEDKKKKEEEEKRKKEEAKTRKNSKKSKIVPAGSGSSSNKLPNKNESSPPPTESNAASSKKKGGSSKKKAGSPSEAAATDKKSGGSGKKSKKGKGDDHGGSKKQKSPTGGAADGGDGVEVAEVTFNLVGAPECGKKWILAECKKGAKDKDAEAEGEDDDEFESGKLEIKLESQTIVCNVVDNQPGEEYARFRALNYQSADVFFVCFNLGNEGKGGGQCEEEVEKLESEWIKEIRFVCPEVPLVFLGIVASDGRGKVDGEVRARKKKKAEELAESVEGMFYEIDYSAGHKGKKGGATAGDGKEAVKVTFHSFYELVLHIYS